MSAETIGYFTLNVSFVLYLTWFLPQLIHNIVHKNTRQLSIFMHYILCCAYTLDLIYGFGREMPWQYKTVTLVGLTCLAIQHIQIYRYGSFSEKEKRSYWTFTFIFLCLLFGSVYNLYAASLSKEIFIAAGLISQAGWLVYALPQIFKNHQLKSTSGISIYFVLISIVVGICDIVSAWSLSWDIPNKIGGPLSTALKVLLLLQFFRYRGLATQMGKQVATPHQKLNPTQG